MPVPHADCGKEAGEVTGQATLKVCLAQIYVFTCLELWEQLFSRLLAQKTMFLRTFM